MKTFFKDLKLDTTTQEIEDFHLFRFIHQTHLHTSLKVMDKGSTLDPSPFNAVDKYNETSFKNFLRHPL